MMGTLHETEITSTETETTDEVTSQEEEGEVVRTTIGIGEEGMVTNDVGIGMEDIVGETGMDGIGRVRREGIGGGTRMVDGRRRGEGRVRGKGIIGETRRGGGWIDLRSVRCSFCLLFSHVTIGLSVVVCSLGRGAG